MGNTTQRVMDATSNSMIHRAAHRPIPYRKWSGKFVQGLFTPISISITNRCESTATLFFSPNRFTKYFE